jgi:hypothetical protein
MIQKMTPPPARRKRGAGAKPGKNRRTVNRKILDELPAPGGEGEFNYAEGVKEISPALTRWWPCASTCAGG